MSFLEEEFSQIAAYGAQFLEMFETEVVETNNGNEYRSLRHPYPRAEITLNFNNRTEVVMMDTILDLYQRSAGTFGGFRFQNPLEYSSNGRKGTPTAADQQCSSTSTAGVYQLTKWYGTQGSSTAARRLVYKPNTGTVLVGIRDESDNDVAITATGVSPLRWTVDTTTGLITFDANKSYSITGITQAAQAVVTIGSHTLVANDSVHFSNVGGMTEINGLRGTVQSVTATTITVDINSSAFTAFSTTSPLGQVNTRPQANETVTAGFTFDLPVRFLSDVPVQLSNRDSDGAIMNAPIVFIELLNPSNA